MSQFDDLSFHLHCCSALWITLNCPDRSYLAMDLSKRMFLWRLWRDLLIKINWTLIVPNDGLFSAITFFTYIVYVRSPSEIATFKSCFRTHHKKETDMMGPTKREHELGRGPRSDRKVCILYGKWKSSRVTNFSMR